MVDIAHLILIVIFCPMAEDSHVSTDALRVLHRAKTVRRSESVRSGLSASESLIGADESFSIPCLYMVSGPCARAVCYH